MKSLSWMKQNWEWFFLYFTNSSWTFIQKNCSHAPACKQVATGWMQARLCWSSIISTITSPRAPCTLPYHLCIVIFKFQFEQSTLGREKCLNRIRDVMWIQRIYKKSITWYLWFLRFHVLACYKNQFNSIQCKLLQLLLSSYIFFHFSFFSCTSQPDSHDNNIVFCHDLCKNQSFLQHQSTWQCSNFTRQHFNYHTLCSKVIHPQLHNQCNKNNSLATQIQSMV